MPVYQIEKHTGKGPQLFTDHCELIAPDMLIVDTVTWIEAKHKTVFSWHRKTKKWVTGIDLKHYQHYRDVSVISSWPVWILFLHQNEIPALKDRGHNSPEKCPVGLFGGSLDILVKNESHQTPPLNAVDNVKGHGKSGMVYWAREIDGGPLRLVATLEEVRGTA